MLGSALLAQLRSHDVVPIDRRDGQEIGDEIAMRKALASCELLVHLAALHPLVADRDSDYTAANVTPFTALLAAANGAGVRRIILASSTSVWSDAPAGAPCRFIDEATPPDGEGGYAKSKLACEAALARSGVPSVVFRLARFARDADPEDATRLLYRAVRPVPAAGAMIRAALDDRISGLFALSGPTPFRPEDAERLSADPRAVIRERTGMDPSWVPDRIGSVIVTDRAQRELGWAG